MAKNVFVNDYSELVHPDMLAAFAAAGTGAKGNYGLDGHSARAASLIREKIGRDDASIHFAAGGTQANMLVLSHALRPYEAVIACESGHIATHETGAIEATGHKVCVARGEDGKLTASAIAEAAQYHSDEHMVKPRLVYISDSTEYGTAYTKAELTRIREACDEYGLYLYVDGARLGCAMNAKGRDLTYGDLGRLADAFYIGGTKNGALFGEAIVLLSGELKANFRHQIKHRGAMLAKGAAIGVQFEALFEGGLYDRLASRSNEMAYKLAGGIESMGYGFRYKVETNQIFPLLPKTIASALSAEYGFHIWEEIGGYSAVRLVASWATTDDMVDGFLSDLNGAAKGIRRSSGDR